MDYTNFIARRYLFERKHVSLISTLTIISITGITLGVALLIVVLSVFNGFFDVVKGLLLAYDPDIRVESVEGNGFLADAQPVAALDTLPEIRVISPYIEGKALLIDRGRTEQVVKVKGVETEAFLIYSELDQAVTTGRFDLAVSDRKPGLVMGEQNMLEMKVTTGDKLTLMSAAGMQKALTQFSGPRAYNFEVRGAYSLKRAFDEPVVFVDLQAARRMFDMGKTVSGLDITLTDHARAEEAKTQLEATLGPSFRVSSWYDLQKPLYDVMYIEKWGAFIILMIIVLVAILNIIGSLTMIVIQKSRDIGVLRTLGCTPGQIKTIFLKQGLYIGLIGCGVGGVLGFLLCWLQKEFGLVGLSDSFIIDAYPVAVQLSDVLIILTGSLLLSIAASWYPSKRAAAIEPASAVRYE